jgi:hypothetical protein
MIERKVIFIQVLFLLFISCQSENEKKLLENNTSGLNVENQIKTLIDEKTIIDNSVIETDTTINIDSEKIGIQLKTMNSNPTFSFKMINNSKDSIIIFLESIEDLKSIKPNKNNLGDWKIEQKYQSELRIGVDGKQFILDNWKRHESPWIKIWNDRNGNNVKTYSYFDSEYFPEFSNKELIDGIRLNEKMFSKHWTDFLIKEFSKQNRSEDAEPFFHPVITESHFKIIIKEKIVKYIIVRHLEKMKYGHLLPK